ncbi:hemicentin-2 isoform X2 [Takifugu rubripes]|uniref:hemicentin-2 isoform X2 n=1 Tax=Takifugu rubripes TaxID=31033 RepID=UPI0011454521|nr:hemicentin-2-like isoform X2 [Takifugu rubripes]
MFQFHHPTCWSNMSHLRRMLGFLILMFLQCEADKSCSPGLINLDPEVVVEYGETVVLNCTSTSEDDLDVFWKIGMEEELSYVEVPGTKWDMKAECVIQLNDSFQCSNEVNIVVYKTPDSVSVSADVTQEGAEMVLSCDVTNVAPLQALRVKWYRGNDMVHTQMLNDTSRTPASAVSTFRTAVMREDNGVEFRCAAELHLGPNGPELVPTVTSSAYTAVVLYKPRIQGCSGHFRGVEGDITIDRLPCHVDGNPPPTVQWYHGGTAISASVPLTRTGSGEYTAEVVNSLGKSITSVNITVEYAPTFKENLLEISVPVGANVELSCDAEGHPQPHLNWTCDGAHEKETTNHLYIVQIEHNMRCQCTASNYLHSATKEFIIVVVKPSTAVPPAAITTPEAVPQSACPVILTPAEVVVRFGDPLSINCSTSAANVKEIDFIVSFGKKQVEQPLSVSWAVEEVKEWDVNAECFVTLEQNQCFKMPNVIVYKTPDSVSVSAGVTQEGAEMVLSCDVTNVAPLQALRVKWYRGNDMVHTQMLNDTSRTPASAVSTFRTAVMREDNGVEFRCAAELHLGPNGPELVPTVTSSAYTAVVLYKPRIQGCSGHFRGVEGDITIDRLPCHVDGNPPPTVQWYHGGTAISASVPLTRTGSGEYTAEVVNSLGKSITSVNITVEYAPTFKENLLEISVPVGANVELSCDAEGHPQPHLNWTCDGAHEKETTNHLYIVQIEHNMRCQCTASNYLHSATKEFIIVVVKPSTAVPPAAITTPEAVPQSACPVILTPAEVVVRFGDPLSINCSTSAANVKEIDFIVSFGKKQVEQPLSVSWAVEEVKEWDVNAECFVTLEQNQCFKMPNVIVYKTPDSVSVSAGVTQEGAEMVLSCDVTNVAPLQALRVKWYRGNDMVHTQMLNDTSRTPASAVSTFRTAVMREDNGVEFRCAAELHLGPNGPELVPTVTSSAYTAVVLYKPRIQGCSGHFRGVEGDITIDRLPCHVDGNPPPTVQWYHGGTAISASVPLTRTGSGEYTAEVVNSLGKSITSVNITVEYAPTFKENLLEISVPVGANVELSCDAEGHPQPHLNWTCDGAHEKETTNHLYIVQIEHNMRCQCTASNYLHSATKEFIIVVVKPRPAVPPAAITTPEAVPQSACPVILTPAEVVVRFGDPLSINCSTSAANVKEIDFIVSFGKKQVEQPLSVSWAVEEVKEWDVNAECFVTLEQNQCSEMPNVIVYKTPDSVSVSAGVTQEGAEMVLSCDVTNVAPLQALRVKWYRGNDMVHTQMFNDTSRTPASAVSTLRNTAVREDNGVEFRCAAELHLGPNGPELVPTVTSSAYTAVVLYKPRIQGCSGHFRGVEGDITIDRLPCHVDGNPPPTVQWYHGGTAISASVPLTRTGSGEYTAEVVNSLGKSSTSVYITVEYSPSFTCNQHYEIKEDAQVQSVCEPDGLPPPIITWTKDGAVIPTPPRWTKHDSGNYSLTATNKHGTRSHWLYLNVLYAPVFNLESYTQEVYPGENVNLDCSAEGNPPPEISWEYAPADNAMVTGGRQKSIRITGATSTNAGVYVCVAKSKAGRVTRSVTLLMKGESSRVPPEVLWLLPLLLIIIILLVVLLYRTCKKKHGEYRFVADRAKDGSDVSIPLTTKHKGVQA